jgi:hypothetical protein
MASSLLTSPLAPAGLTQNPNTNRGQARLDRNPSAVQATNEANGVCTHRTTLEYDTKGGNKVRVLGVNAEHKTVTIQDNDGNCQAFIWSSAKGVYEQKISGFNSGGWTVAGSYLNVEVTTDGTVIAHSADGRVLTIAADGKESCEV